MVFGEATEDFFSDNGAEFALGFEFCFGVADAAEVEFGAIADVTLVSVRPLD